MAVRWPPLLQPTEQRLILTNPRDKLTDTLLHRYLWPPAHIFPSLLEITHEDRLIPWTPVAPIQRDFLTELVLKISQELEQRHGVVRTTTDIERLAADGLPVIDGGLIGARKIAARTEQRRIVNWDNKYLEHVRIRYGLTLSGEWPRLALVRSLNGSASSIDTIVHDWPQMETKALVIGGELDGPTFPERARNVAESLANAGLVLLPNAAHNPHVEIPDVFNPELIRFLKSDPNVPASEGW